MSLCRTSKASLDQIAWVLTSYIVCSAIMMPLTGWLAGRFGIKYVFLASVASFTVASALCGAATSLGELVLFRALQGLAGAGLIPLSQAMLLQINPPERHGHAMAVFGIGTILGPIMGPALGGWLTQDYNWRWIFYINLPIGVPCTLGALIFIRQTRNVHREPFDFVGFLTLSLGIGALQLMLDRGELKDWFHSSEIWIEATVAGLVTVPRGFGSMAAMFFIARVINRVDNRMIILFGFLLTALSMWQMTQLSLQMGMSPMIISGLLQGFGLGCTFVPLNIIALSNLPRHILTQGTAIRSLMRNLGSSIGISVLVATLAQNTQVVHSRLAEGLRPNNPLAQAPYLPASFSLTTPGGIAALNAEVTRQAAMVAYIDDFKLLMLIALASVPLLLLLREERRRPPLVAVAATSAADD